jgi:hypothetical protein
VEVRLGPSERGPGKTVASCGGQGVDCETSAVRGTAVRRGRVRRQFLEVN